MPSEHIAALTHPLPDQSQQQIKLCASCHCPLSTDSPNTPFILYDGDDTNDATIVCGPCRTSLLTHRIDTPPVSIARGEFLFAQVERELRRRAESLPDGNNEAYHSQQQLDTLSFSAQHFALDEDIQMDAPLAPRPQPPSSSHPTTPPYAVSLPQPAPALASGSSSTSRKPLRVVVGRDALPHPPQTPASSYAAHHHHTATPISRASSSRSQQAQPAPATSSYPDPLVDITRLRVRSQGHHCLYPGASFQGTQKSGRNSYDVNVTIVVRLVLFPFFRPIVQYIDFYLFILLHRTSTLPRRTYAAICASAASRTTGLN